MLRSMIAATVALLMAVGAAPLAVAQESKNSSNTARYIVVLKDSVQRPGSVASEHSRNYGVEVSHVYRHALKGYAGQMSARSAARISNDRRVDFVETDQKVRALGEVPTGVDRIEADKKLNLSDGSSVSYDLDAIHIDIAVLDTGIDGDHVDLDVAGGWNCAKGGPFNNTCDAGGYEDGNGHGTHVAGTAAAIDHATGDGVAGVAPGARLWAVKVLDNSGSGWISWIVAGIDQVTHENTDSASDNDIEIANMSLGCECESDSLDQALFGSTDSGAVYVVAAGNSGEDAAAFSPANHPEVIAVSAMADYDGLAGGGASPTCRDDSGDDDTFAPWSNYGDVVDLAAPGVCITSTVPGGYDVYSGTSMASPHGAGAAALYVVENDVPKNESRWSTVRDGLRGTGWSVPQSDDCGVVAAGKSSEPVLMLSACDTTADIEDDTTPPAAPTNLEVSDPSTGGALDLDWADNDESDLAGYNVYRSDDGGASYQKVNPSLVASSAYQDTGLVNGTTYTYYVTAVDTSGNESDPSATASGSPTDTTAPASPSGLTASAGDQQVSLDWADNDESDLDGYNVYRSEDGGSTYQKVNSDLVGSSEFTDTSLTNETTYHYYVTAVDTTGNESEPSDVVSATPSDTLSVHVHDLDGSATSLKGGYWRATVRIYVYDSNENPVADATVSGTWSAGSSGGTCTTNGSGWCEVTSSEFHKSNLKSVDYTVDDVSGSYEPTANHDPDGDSTGTMITVSKDD